MAEKGKPVNQIGNMAFWFGTLSTLSNSCIAKLVSDDWQDVFFSASGIFVALVSAGIVWLFCKFGKPLDLVRYESQLTREIKNIESALARPGISDEAKLRLQKKLDNAVERLATAESDVAAGTIAITAE